MGPSLSASEWSLLAELTHQPTLPVSELPYTDEFEKVYTTFTVSTKNAIERHHLWLAILQIEQHRPDLATESSPSQPPQQPVVTQPPSPSKPAGVESRMHAGGNAISGTAPASLFDLQPWQLPKPEPVLDAAEIERQALLKAIAESDLGKTEQKVAYILQRYPETRDSDTALAIRYWTVFQSDILEQWDRLDLSVLFALDRIETIARIRRHIQNVLRLFTASIFTRQQRNELQMEFNQYLALQRPVEAEIRFYLDETGNEPGKAYTGVAGICVMNWKQYEKHWASLTQWRRQQGWPETIHFVDTGNALQPKALALLAELQRRRSGLLFVGYALPSRGNTHQAMFSLFIQLVIDSLHHVNELQCLTSPRSLTVIKEAEPGFDNLFLTSMQRCLAEQIGREFPNQVVFDRVEALPKGREVLLECADLVAGGMQRRALYGGRNPKDVLAEAAFNVTGFDDPRDNGTVFKAYPS